VPKFMSWDPSVVEERLAIFRIHGVFHSTLRSIGPAVRYCTVLLWGVWTNVGDRVVPNKLVLLNISLFPGSRCKSDSTHTSCSGPGGTRASVPRYLGLGGFSAAVRSGCCGSDILSNLIVRNLSSFRCL